MALTRRTTKRNFCFVKEGNIMVSTEEILYISSGDHQLQFHMLGEELSPYRMYRKLDELEEDLHEMNFLRIHKSYLVNLQYIKK